MTNPTSNFGWQMPTSTDLVTDLPADFEVFGQAVDTSLADLKGGTTNQILAKNSNTDMDFKWVANDVGDITAVTAGTGISGGGTTGDVTITNTMATAIDAKGDLIAGTGADTFSRLAAGSNGDIIISDSTAPAGLRWQGSQSAGKNAIINGGFDIWQRSTSSSTNGGYTTADRWTRDGANCTTSRQSTGAPTGSNYVMRNAFTSASGAYVTQFQYIETANVAPLLGRQATFSVRLRRSSGMASNLAIYVQKNATVDAGGSTGGWTTIDAATITNASLPTGTTSADWYLAQLGVAIPNDGTANSLRVYILTATEPGNGSYWEMAQVQLEMGYQTTAFSRAGGTISGELAACQRYYWRSTGGAAYSVFGGNCSAWSTVDLLGGFNLPVTMRTNPTSVEYSSLIASDGVNNNAVGTLTFSSAYSSPNVGGFSATSTSLTAFRFYRIQANNSTSAYVAYSAEL